MEQSRRDQTKDLVKLCREARDRGLTVPEIDALPDVACLFAVLYPVRHLVRMGRHAIIRSFLQEVDEKGVRTHVAVVQQMMFDGDPEEGDGDTDATRHARVYQRREEVLRQPSVAREALRSAQGQVHGTIQRQALLHVDLKSDLLFEIDSVFARMAERLGG